MRISPYNAVLMLARLIGFLLCLLVLAPIASRAESLTAERYRQYSPFYIREVIPENPGSVTVQLADGKSLMLGFMGTSQLERVNPPATRVRAQFISTPGGKWNLGLAFYQGTFFNFGLPRRYTVNRFNRFTNPAEAFGTIRVVMWSGRQRYEIDEGEVQLTKFRETSRTGNFRLWHVEGLIRGKFRQEGQSMPGLPPTLEIARAAFSCVMIEDRNPVPNRIQLTFDQYYEPTLSLLVRADFAPGDTVQAFDFDASRRSEESQYIIHQVIFHIRDSSNLSWPPSGQYQLNMQTVDPPDILLPEGAGTRPLVMSLIYRPAPDIEFHYMPESGTWTFDTAQMMANNERTEVWRVKGSVNGTFRLDDRKIGVGSIPTPLAIHPGEDYLVVKVTGNFDILVRRPATPQPLWKQKYPGLNPITGLELPNV